MPKIRLGLLKVGALCTGHGGRLARCVVEVVATNIQQLRVHEELKLTVAPRGAAEDLNDRRFCHNQGICNAFDRRGFACVS